MEEDELIKFIERMTNAGTLEPEETLKKEKALVAAILCRAVLDLSKPSQREGVWEWFLFSHRSKKGSIYFSFLDCCECLDLNPSAIIDELIRNGKLPINEPPQ